VQKELTKLKAIDSSTNIQPLIAQLRAAEEQCAEELSQVHVGSRFGAGFVSGLDSTSFIDYLATVESSKGLLASMQQPNSDRGAIFALNQQPSRQVRERSTTSRVQSTYDNSTQERESTSEESEGEAPPPKSANKKKDKHAKGVFFAGEAEHQDSSAGVYPIADRCSRDNRSVCASRACEQRHARYNKQSTTICEDDNTPGIWCERAFEIGGAGCPHLHHQDVRSNPNAETRPPPYPNAGARPPPTSYHAQSPRKSERQSTQQRDYRGNSYQPPNNSRRDYSNKPIPCQFFFRNGEGCKAGKRCRFSHEKINR
jgi:hypothetical protein